MSCNATTKQIARSIYADPLADRVRPGYCRVCGRQLESTHRAVDMGHGRQVRMVRALCDGIPPERVDAAYRLAETMRVEAYRYRDEYLRAARRRRREEQEQERRDALDALGLPPDPYVSATEEVEIDTGEF